MSSLHERMKSVLNRSKFCKNVYRKLIKKGKSPSQEFCLVYSCYLAEEGKIVESLKTLYYALKNFDHHHLTCEKIVPIMWEIVDYLKKENLKSFRFEKDGFLCSYCLGVLCEPLTLSCGHTYCRKCFHTDTFQACFVCSSSKDASAPETDVLVSSLVQKWWFRETRAAPFRTEGDQYLEEKKYMKALHTFTEAYYLAPNDHLLLCSRSRANLLLGNEKEALKDACEAALHRPQWAKAHFCKSSALLALGREEDALVAMLVYALLANTRECERVYYEVSKLVLLLMRRSAIRADGSHSSLNSSRKDKRYSKEIERVTAESTRSRRKKRRASSIKASLHHFITEDVPIISRVMGKLFGEISKLKICANSCQKINVNDSIIQCSDFECPLCFLCFWEPVTTVCGHTFCRSCLARSLDHASQCPLCKTSLKDYSIVESASFVNQFLEHAMKTLVPREFSERSLQHDHELSELAKAGQDLEHEIPIFVATIAIPTIACPLHVFEPRYRLMIRRVMEAGTKEFGMCMPSQAGQRGFSDYGTLLKILEVKPLSDGRRIVHAIGSRRFKCMTKSARDGYNTATVEFIQDHEVSGEDLPKLKLLHDIVNKRARLWFETVECDMKQRILSHYGEMPCVEGDYWLLSDGPAWVWWLIAILPLEPCIQMRIIKEQSLSARLSQVSQVLKYVVSHQTKTKL